MDYLAKRTQELRELAQSYDTKLRENAAQLNRELNEIDWAGVEHNILLECLQELGFGKVEKGKDGTLYANAETRRTIVVPKHRPMKRKPKRKRLSPLQFFWLACVIVFVGSITTLRALNEGGYFDPSTSLIADVLDVLGFVETPEPLFAPWASLLIDIVYAAMTGSFVLALILTAILFWDAITDLAFQGEDLDPTGVAKLVKAGFTAATLVRRVGEGIASLDFDVDTYSDFEKREIDMRFDRIAEDLKVAYDAAIRDQERSFSEILRRAHDQIKAAILAKEAFR